MNQEALANCFCIISHPSSPKFLVVKHADGWFPPMVQFPVEGFVGLKAQLISDSVLTKYGLRTAVLRHTFESLNLHCVELEVISQARPVNMEAVWVGEAEYKRFRSSEPGGSDPLEGWLRQAASKRTPAVRPPWERKGWFNKASGWLEHELELAHVQPVGSVQQHQMCWHDSALLRVRTSQGVHFLKASHPEAPCEGEITRVLARRWPSRVSAPLAASKKHNWMVFQDLGASLYTAPEPTELASAARAMAQMQFESVGEPGLLKEEGAPRSGPRELAGFLARVERLDPLLQSGLHALDDDEMKAFHAAVPGMIAACERLQNSRIPEALLHPDFLPSRAFRSDGGFRFNGWSALCLGHPFFSGAGFARAVSERARSTAPGEKNAMDESWLPAISEAYLEPFSEHAGFEELQAALMLCSGLLGAWDLYRWHGELDRIEAGSVSFAVRQRSVQKTCRQIARTGGADD